MCPFSEFCYTERSQRYGFYPSMHDFAKGDLMLTYSASKQYVSVLESGMMVSVIRLDSAGEEAPYALLTSGFIVGLSELQARAVDVEEAYYCKAVTSCSVCRISRSAVFALLEQHPRLNKVVLGYGLTNSASASAAMVSIVTRKRVYDKVRYLFNVLDDMIDRDPDLRFRLKLTHNDIAYLVSSDRVSVTRALAKMQDEGLVSLGYRSIQHFGDKEGFDELPFDYFFPDGSLNDS